MEGNMSTRHATNVVSPSSAFDQAVELFLAHLQARNYARGSVATYGYGLRLLGQFLAREGLTDPYGVKASTLESYRHYLSAKTSLNGGSLAVATQSHRLQAVRVFFRWLHKSGRLPHNPAEGLESPISEHRLPPATLTVQEVEAIMAVPKLTSPFGLRDRAILQTFYCTGIRRCELMVLKLGDLDRSRGTLFISQGKGHKDRYVPIGARALYWVDRYLTEARPRLAPSARPDPALMFLTYRGEGLSRDYLSETVSRHIDAANTAKRGSCHLLRHTAATLMLEGGADIRYIAELLGHSRLDTTLRYTRVSINQLRHIHALTHPGARLRNPAHHPTRYPSAVTTTQ
jgi:integrase/recombinase XerD